ncbi:hypothetical protein [Niallia taxi]|uniref:hypothetical protein n=1 Tax=Niallia taxi TaxID=2499688 RepID=UPI0015F37154|nr:hypothetical protein [Niallia taxi]
MDKQKIKKYLGSIASYVVLAEVDMREDDTISAATMLYHSALYTMRLVNPLGIDVSSLGKGFDRDLAYIIESEGDLTEEEVIMSYSLMHRLYNELASVLLAKTLV